MRTAPPETLSTDIRPALTAHVAEADLMRLFPVLFDDVDPLAAAEPSKAALLQLDSGRLAVVEYGTVTSTVTVSVPSDADTGETLLDLLLEAPLLLEPPSRIDWLSKDVGIGENWGELVKKEEFVLELRRTIRRDRRPKPSLGEQSSLDLPSPHRKN
jgi:hypothetical protein